MKKNKTFSLKNETLEKLNKKSRRLGFKEVLIANVALDLFLSKKDEEIFEAVRNYNKKGEDNE